jgi:hypothetical protein
MSSQRVVVFLGDALANDAGFLVDEDGHYGFLCSNSFLI